MINGVKSKLVLMMISVALVSCANQVRDAGQHSEYPYRGDPSGISSRKVPLSISGDELREIKRSYPNCPAKFEIEKRIRKLYRDPDSVKIEGFRPGGFGYLQATGIMADLNSAIMVGYIF
jgi:hypothetical protein